MLVVRPFTSPTISKKSWTPRPLSASRATSRAIREVIGRWRRERAGDRPALITTMAPKATTNSIIRTTWGVERPQGAKESTKVQTISSVWCQGRQWTWVGRRKRALSSLKCQVFIHQLLKLRPASTARWMVALQILAMRHLTTSLACPQVTKRKASTQASRI